MIALFFFFSLFLIYSAHDIKTHEVPWKWLILGILSVNIIFYQNVLVFLLVFMLFYVLSQFIEVGGADVIVLAMISSILGLKGFVVYLVVLSIITTIMVLTDIVLKKKSKNIAFIPYLEACYIICLIFL